MNDDVLATPAWVLVGTTRNVPGLIELADGRLAFASEAGRVFEAALSDVTDIAFPWWYFGGGMKLSVAGESYRISFVRPNGAADIPGRLAPGYLAEHGAEVAGAGIALLTVGLKARDIGEGRGAGRAWKQTLLSSAR